MEIFVSVFSTIFLPWAMLTSGASGEEPAFPPGSGASASAAQAAAAKPANDEIRLEGVVTAVKPGEWLMLRTLTGSYEVALTAAQSAFHPGDEVDLFAKAQTSYGITRLTDAEFERIGAQPSPRPVMITRAEDAAHGDFIAVEGRVRDVFQGRNRARLVLALDGGRASCTVFLEQPLDVSAMEMPRYGSLVRVEGPCFRRSMYWWLGSDVSIASALGTRVETIAPPPYWNMSHLRQMLWFVALALGVVLGLGTWLWMRSSRQARRQSELAQSAAVARERQRIAWEIHDSVHQEIAAARMHLDNLKTAAQLCPEAVPALAEQTQAMLRHCEGETRNCVWDLRAGITGEFALGTTLRRWLEVRQPPDGRCSMKINTSGESLGLDREQSFQILRIAQETVNNAMAHALAPSIEVTLRRTGDGVELLVEDDGCGFETGDRSGRGGIHFGLTMLQERAARIRAQIQVRSELGVGTRLRLLLPQAELAHG